MPDTFDQVISRIMQPIEQMTMGPLDTTYLMRHDGAFVYVEGYWHPGDTAIGKLIYYPDPRGSTDIHGRKYSSIIKEERDGKTAYVSHKDQIKKLYRLYPDLPPDSHKLSLCEYQVAFPRSSFAGFFNDRRALEYVMEHFPRVGEIVRQASELFEVPLKRLGITGSSALGRRGLHSDIDLVFFGTVEENWRVVRKLWSIIYSEPERQVVEYGKFWPLKIYIDKNEVCTFFVYRDLAEAPVRDCAVEMVKEKVEAYGTVAENIHSLYVPVVLTLENVYVDGEKHPAMDFVVYDGAVRGEFKKGLRLHIKGRLVNIVRGKKKTLTLAALDGFDIEVEKFKAGVPAFDTRLAKA